MVASGLTQLNPDDRTQPLTDPMPRTHKNYTGNSIQIITAPANINTAPRKLYTIRIHKPPHAEKDKNTGVYGYTYTVYGQIARRIRYTAAFA